MPINKYISTQYQGVYEEAANPQQDGLIIDNTSDFFRPNVISAIGDSIVQNCNQKTAATIVANGNTLTITAVSHRMCAGFEFYISGCAQEDLNIRGVCSAGTDVNTVIFNGYTGSFQGTATAKAGKPGIFLTTLCVSAEPDWIGWAAYLSKGAILKGISYGFGGEDTVYIKTKISDLYSKSPQYIIEQSGINDIRASVQASAIFENKKNMWLSIIEAGLSPMITTLTPLSNSVSGWTTAQFYQILKLNQLIRDYAQNNPYVVLVDLYAKLVDPLSTTGNWKSGMTLDGLHPNGKAAYLMGQELYNVLSVHDYSNEIKVKKVSSAVEAFGISPQIPQIIDNPLLTDNAGGLAGGATGSVATGWTLTKVGGGTAVGSIVARADGYGNDQQIVCVAAAANDGATLVGWAINNRILAGQSIQAVFDLDMSSCTNLSRLEFSIGYTSGGVSGLIALNRISDSQIDGGNKTITFMSQAIKFNVAANLFNMTLTITHSNAGGSTIKVGRMSIWVN